MNQAIRIPFYVIFDAWKEVLEAYRLVDGCYVKMQPNDRGNYPVLPMGVEIGLQQVGTTTWLRWWDELGNLLLTGDERAIAEKQARLDAEEIADRATLAQQQAEAIAEQERAIANQQKAIADEATLAQQQAEAIAKQERQQKEKLAKYLRSIGINPDEI